MFVGITVVQNIQKQIIEALLAYRMYIMYNVAGKNIYIISKDIIKVT